MPVCKPDKDLVARSFLLVQGSGPRSNSYRTVLYCTSWLFFVVPGMEGCTIHSPWLLRYECSSIRLWWDDTYCEYLTWCLLCTVPIMFNCMVATPMVRSSNAESFIYLYMCRMWPNRPFSPCFSAHCTSRRRLPITSRLLSDGGFHFHAWPTINYPTYPTVPGSYRTLTLSPPLLPQLHYSLCYPTLILVLTRDSL